LVTPRPPTSEPCVRRIVVPAFRQAIVDTWGEPGRAQVIAALRDEAREAFVNDGAHKGHWFPARHVIAWAFATWEGPAHRVREDMARCIRRQWDLSFGIVRRTLLLLAHPAPIVPKLPRLWTEDNSSGELAATLEEGGQGATLRIAGTPFADTPHGRASMAEVYRHAFSRTRASQVTETHAADGPSGMVIRLKWII